MKRNKMKKKKNYNNHGKQQMFLTHEILNYLFAV